MSYKLSIIIPTYNAENTILNAVNSIKNQSMDFKKIEIILVDDNSTDKTREILKKLSKDNSNIKCVFLDENSGSPSKPRNEGINLSTTEYLMFLDNNDTYCETMCEVMYSVAEKYNADVVSCRNYNIYDSDNKKTVFKSVLDKKEKIIKLNSIEEDTKLLTTTSMLIWNKIYKKSLIKDNNIKFPIGSLYEDNIFNIQAYIKSKKTIFLNDYYGYNYNIRVATDKKSTSQDFKKENLLKFKKGLENIFNILIEENKSYPSFEAEMLAGFMKWLIYTNTSIEEKIKIFKEVKIFYKRYSILTRITFINIISNIIINIAIKLIYYNTFCFKAILKIYAIITSR